MPRETSSKKWSDTSLLSALPNPSANTYTIVIESSELSFLGVPNQPDFAHIHITFVPDKTIIELKSLKLYLQQFRDIVMSYERLLNVIFKDLTKKYAPKSLQIIITCNARGGISSKLTIDSASQIISL